MGGLGRRCGVLLWVAVGFLMGLANCQTYNASCQRQSGQFAFSSQADIDAYSTCDGIVGKVLIQSDTLQSVNLNGYTFIEGNLEISSCPQLQNISSSTLNNIAFGDFILDDLPLLTTIDFSNGTFLVQSLKWSNLPLLTHGFSTTKPELHPGVGGLFVTNTSLRTIEFFNYSDILWQATDSADYNIVISDNSFLTFANLSTMYGDAMGINITNTNNSGLPNLTVAFPDLKEATNIIISNVANFDFPALNSVTASLTISNTGLNDISFPNLTTVGLLEIKDNEGVSSIDLPSLTTIEEGTDIDIPLNQPTGLRLSNNPSLSTLNLSSLAQIYGPVNITGPFNKIAFPKLDVLAWDEGGWDWYEMGSFHINSTAATLDCTAFDKSFYFYKTVYKGQQYKDDPVAYSCEAHFEGKKDSATHWKAPRLSYADKGGIIASCVVVGLVGLALVVRLVFKRWMKRGGKGTADTRRWLDRWYSSFAIKDR